MSLTAATACIASLFAFLSTYRLLRSHRTRLKICAVFLLGILAIPATLYSVYYLHILPEKEWFYTLRSYPASDYLVIFQGTAAGASATLIPRKLLILPLFGTLVLALAPSIKPLLNPLPPEALEEKWEDGVCLQSTASTCGPASIATILKFLGTDASEREIANYARTSGSGTEAWYLARYLRERGLEPKFVFGDGFIPDGKFPAVVGVKVSGYGHFIAVLEVSDSLVSFADPLSGGHSLPLQDFLVRYEFTGFHLTVYELLQPLKP